MASPCRWASAGTTSTSCEPGWSRLWPHDIVLLSGGTSKGAGDLAHQAVGRLERPGIIIHGVALKPGKPLCIAVTDGRPVVVLPGFPTSAIFTFHTFVAPMIRAMAGLPASEHETVPANLAVRTPSERGRTEYLMVSLVDSGSGLAAYPTAKGSGSVTAFSQADGFIAVPAQTEALPAGAAVEVQVIGRRVRPPDLVLIGSHCLGLDLIIGRLEAEGIAVKALNVGSSGGVAAARRGECDLAGVHLLDPATGLYNRHLLATGDLELVSGYRRLQGLVFRADDARFVAGATAADALAAALADPGCLMINRNAGSGTRILIDRPPGRSAACPATGHRPSPTMPSPWPLPRAARTGASRSSPRPMPTAWDFCRCNPSTMTFWCRRRGCSAPVQRFIALLADPAVRHELAALGFEV